MKVFVRPARAEDMPAVLAIYNYEVANGVATFDTEPRSLEVQMAWLESHRDPYCALVAVDGEEVVGFGCLSRYHERPAYGLSVEDTVYVHQDRRRQGIGRLLLEALIAEGRARHFHTILGRITGENRPSIELHAQLGFVEAGREREVGRKFGRWLDVVTMQLMLD
ncbi:MAG TPA: GNAT family N-acetyltransferase [Dehalococcoidia bacterium]|nr:GNAT family N-acetyltransferase [Dehalococcoidia bacterium]